MIKKESEIIALCPWCGKGKTLANKHADIWVSTLCAKCGNRYKVNFKTMEIESILSNSPSKERISFG